MPDARFRFVIIVISVFPIFVYKSCVEKWAADFLSKIYRSLASEIDAHTVLMPTWGFTERPEELGLKVYRLIVMPMSLPLSLDLPKGPDTSPNVLDVTNLERLWEVSPNLFEICYATYGMYLKQNKRTSQSDVSSSAEGKSATQRTIAQIQGPNVTSYRPASLSVLYVSR